MNGRKYFESPADVAVDQVARYGASSHRRVAEIARFDGPGCRARMDQVGLRERCRVDGNPISNLLEFLDVPRSEMGETTMSCFVWELARLCYPSLDPYFTC
jgi:hypothetical protein